MDRIEYFKGAERGKGERRTQYPVAKQNGFGWIALREP